MLNTYNHRYRKQMITIHPGEYFSSREDVIISTVLGSCIAIVLYDVNLEYSGMNHFMLPGTVSSDSMEKSQTGKYGVRAMDLLVKEMLKKGSSMSDLCAKVFGGGHVMNTDGPIARNTAPHLSGGKKPKLMGSQPRSREEKMVGHRPQTDPTIRSIPADNIRFAFGFLHDRGIPIVSYDTGGSWGRKILVFSRDNSVLLKRLQGLSAHRAAQEELLYLQQLKEITKVQAEGPWQRKTP